MWFLRRRRSEAGGRTVLNEKTENKKYDFKSETTPETHTHTSVRLRLQAAGKSQKTMSADRSQAASEPRDGRRV